MKTRFLRSTIAGLVVVTACGSGEMSVQDRAAGLAISSFREEVEESGLEGVTIDADCVREMMDGATDEEAEHIIADIMEPESSVHTHAFDGGVSSRLPQCVATEALVD